MFIDTGRTPKDKSSWSEPPAVAGGHVRQAHPLPQVVLTRSRENSMGPADYKHLVPPGLVVMVCNFVQNNSGLRE
jgi:hypothetical protein